MIIQCKCCARSQSLLQPTGSPNPEEPSCPNGHSEEDLALGNVTA
eukprot:COSAG03_NODE_27419_length_253_cov_0.675325_1_plen_44_part_10